MRRATSHPEGLVGVLVVYSSHCYASVGERAKSQAWPLSGKSWRMGSAQASGGPSFISLRAGRRECNTRSGSRCNREQRGAGERRRVMAVAEGTTLPWMRVVTLGVSARRGSWICRDGNCGLGQYDIADTGIWSAVSKKVWQKMRMTRCVVMMGGKEDPRWQGEVGKIYGRGHGCGSGEAQSVSAHLTVRF